MIEEIQQQESLNALRAQSSNLASLQQQPAVQQQVQRVEQLLPGQVMAQGVNALPPGASSLQHNSPSEATLLTAFGQA